MHAATRGGGWSQRLFDWLFYTDTAHVLMHAFLYAVLAGLLAAFIAKPSHSLQRLLLTVLPAVAVIAVAQEITQSISKHTRLDADSLLDICVDLAGGALGAMLFLKASRSQQAKNGG
jgi:VanZ family protein